MRIIQSNLFDRPFNKNDPVFSDKDPFQWSLQVGDINLESGTISGSIKGNMAGVDVNALKYENILDVISNDDFDFESSNGKLS